MRPQRRRDALHRPRAERLVAVELERPVLAGEDARRAAACSVPALPASIGSAGARSPRRPTPWTTQLVDVELLDLDAERPHRVHGRLGVAGAPEALITCTGPSASAPSSTARWRDRLVAGHDDVARRARGAGCDLHSARPRARRRRRSPAPRAARPPRRRGVLARDEQRRARRRARAKWCELEVLDVDALRAERLRDPREHAGTVGHVHAQALQLARVLVRVLRACAAGCPTPPRSSARGSRRRPPSSAASSCSIRAAVLASTARQRLARCRGRCRPRCAGWRRRRASCRGASRRPRRAARARRSASRPAWFTSRFASACGRWLVSATRRSCASRVDRDRHRAERGDEAVQVAVARRVGRRDRREEPRRAVEQLAAARAPPRAPRSRRRDGRRRSARVAGRAAHDAALRRADVGHGGASAPRRARPRLRRPAGDRRATSDQVGALDAPAASDAGRLDGSRARRRRASARRVGVVAAHAATPPRSRAASPSERTDQAQSRRSRAHAASRRAVLPISATSREISSREGRELGSRDLLGPVATAPARDAGAPRR